MAEAETSAATPGASGNEVVGLRSLNKVNILYATANLCAYTVLNTPERNCTLFMAAWIASSLLYPILLALAGRRSGFWRDLGALVAIIVIAEIVGFLVYELRTHNYRYHDSMTVLIFEGELTGSIVVAIICYTVGWWATRWVKTAA